MAKNNNLQDFLNDLAEGLKNVEGETTPYTVNPQDFRTRVEALKKVSGT